MAFINVGKLKNMINTCLPTGTFVRNVIVLVTGATFAQAIGILVAPILTRLYTPENFGVFSLYASILGIVAVVACLRYELAIVLPEKDKDAANLLVLSITTCLCMAVIIFILVALFRNVVANLLSAPELAPWLWFLPLSLIAVGLFQAFNYWSTRRKHFRRLAARNITERTATAGVQVGSGAILNLGSGGLISGVILGHLIATVRLAWQIWKDEGKLLKSYIKISNIKRMLIRHKKFPLYSSWSGLLNTASTMLPALLLGYFFSPVVVGYYALGHRVLALPMGVIGRSVSQVFFPRATEARRAGELDRLTYDLFKRLLQIGFVPFLLLTIVAPDLFALLFGARWWTAGEYVQWLSVWLLFVFISSPLSTMFSVLEKQKNGLIVNIVMFSTRLSVLVIGGLKGNALFTIALFGITGALLWCLNCTYILYMAGVSVKQVYTTILQQVIRALPYAFFPLLILYMFNNSLAFVLAGIAAGIAFILIQIYRVRTTGALL
ncbi:MAG: oligosaccharide flippase family protein [Clostridiales bacterium]|nr:oligosaccharide flippase family protein [Clostridiales bacterium]MCF8022794.1 oligosaccharide flippase family protein [Clostridiales bacterium]